MKFYHYVHCPFCLRVRMTLGYFNLSYQSIVLPYDDEKTPVSLTGTKMLPILEFEDGVAINESLIIMQKLDQKNVLNFALYKDNSTEIEQLLSNIGKDVHSLCMPYWIWTQEFNQDSRKYFKAKKEQTRGPFKELMRNKSTYLNSINSTLKKLELNIDTYYKSSVLTVNDILIASHLWGMYIFPEFQFSEKMHSYLQRIKADCRFEYHKDFSS